MKLLRRMWFDQSGQVSAAPMILLTTIVVLGSIVGLVSLRDQIVQEFGDLAVALESLDQSFSTPLGSYNDPPTTLTDPAGGAPAGLDLQRPPQDELN